MIVTLAILSKQHVDRRTLIPTPKRALNSSILLTSCTGFRTSSSGSWRRFIEEEKISNFDKYLTPTWRWRIYKYVFPLVLSGSGSIKQGRQERNTLATPPADWMWLNTLVCFCHTINRTIPLHRVQVQIPFTSTTDTTLVENRGM